MKATYNGIYVPYDIPANRIISAFANDMDENSLDYYRNQVDMFQVEPIMGYPEIITEDEVGEFFLSGEEITEEHIGEMVWYVTDGHHRSTVAAEMNISIPVHLDYSCLSLKEDIDRYNLLYS